MDRIKAARRQIAERANFLPLIGCPDCITTVLDQPQILLFRELVHGFQIKWVAQRVSNHDRFGLVAVGSLERRTSMLYVPNSTSTNTGTQPFWTIGLTVVGKPAATVITSSPGHTRRSPSDSSISTVNATRFALEPEFTSNEVPDTHYLGELEFKLGCILS